MIGLRKIKAVAPSPGYRLDVTWADETHSLLDMSDEVVADGGIFAALVDAATFATVRVGTRARTIEWRVPLDQDAEGLIDIDADALFVMAETASDRNAQAHAARVGRARG